MCVQIKYFVVLTFKHYNIFVYSFCGFGNALSFKTIDDEEINKIEKRVRENGAQFLASHPDKNAKDFFGDVFASNPKKFEFSPGDVKFINQIVAHVKKIVDGNGINQGIAYFAKDCCTETKVFANEFENSVQMKDVRSESITHFFLNKLLSAADRNSKREQGGYRYDWDVKLFAAYLRTLIGPFAYETLQKNLVHSLPSLPSTNRYIRSSHCNITEGVLRCEELAVYLTERSLEKVVCISMDATRISGRVQYDSKTNQCVGFVPPLHNGIPVPFSFPARNAEEILSHFTSNNSIATFLNVIMAQPIANVAPFCLMAYGSDNRYNTPDVIHLWQHITKELEKVGIKVLCIASDSDPKYNSAMRVLSKLGQPTIFDYFACCGEQNGPFYFQDIVHVATKLRNFLLRSIFDKKIIPFGKNLIRAEHLYELLNMFTKDKHQLTLTTLNPKDKQNFRSVLRICDRRVTNLLRDHVQNSSATVQFLNIMRDIIDSFMDINLTPIQRIRKIWYAVFLIRIWRSYILSSKRFTLKDNFLTMNCYVCIELNAHNMVKCMLYLKKINKPELFMPFLYESQACENIFRQLRSLTTVYSTVINCTLKETIGRISSIQFQNQVVQLTSNNFVFPRAQNSHSSQNAVSLPTADEINKEILFCKQLAMTTATNFSLINKNNSKCKQYVCKIGPLTPQNQTNDFSKKRSVQSVDSISNAFKFKPVDLKNIQLKNFDGKYKSSDLSEAGPYAKIVCADDKEILVKKTSLCWLLGSDYVKLSNDRLLRVQASTTMKNQILIYPQKCKRIKGKRKRNP